ncbi:MAG: cupin domain-containing protein [Promethearchaeota archaeon]|nr:MAG: cupin domain-containing protein [Candidatus Lokiarchaeota archaeon]
MKKINIKNQFGKIENYWNPKIIGELNGQYIKIAKFKGEFIWHEHENEDELFLVIKGELVIELEEETIKLKENECIVIPKGTKHRPVAHKETEVILFEPKSTINTGNKKSHLTIKNVERVDK